MRFGVHERNAVFSFTGINCLRFCAQWEWIGLRAGERGGGPKRRGTASPTPELTHPEDQRIEFSTKQGFLSNREALHPSHPQTFSKPRSSLDVDIAFRVYG